MNMKIDEVQFKDNSYYQINNMQFVNLMTYVYDYPIMCCKVISRRYRQKHLLHNHDIISLMNFILSTTSWLNNILEIVEIQTRVYCIVYNITSINQFPKCKTCNKPIVQNVTTFSKGFGYTQFCCAKCRAINPEYKQKMLEDRMKKYGNIYGDMSKILATRYARYGHTNLKQSVSLKNTYKEHKQEIEQKKSNTLFKHYGVRSPMQSSMLRAKHNVRISYDNKKFDSLSELALYIWLIDHNKQFEFQPNISFEYEFNGVIHKYCPDFKIDNQYVEIKGDQFFKDDGTMQNPYDHSLDALYEAKHQCMIQNNVIILKGNDYKKYEDYVQNKYGYDYLKQFKIKSKQ